MSAIGLVPCESSCLLLVEYSVELHIEYSRTRLIAEVADNYRVMQNKWTTGSPFQLAVQQLFETSQSAASNASQIIIKWRNLQTSH